MNKKIFFIASLIFLSLLLTILIGEIAVRMIYIPGLDKNTHYTVDPLIGYGDIPHSKLIYCSDKREVIQRYFNSFGYLDMEHNKKKREGVYRIGFFGDSYVEARQVEIENTFFRIIEKGLKDYNVECLAFGRESGGTLVAYLNNTRWSPYFDLDAIIYVFCENDPGDNMKVIKEKTAPHFPFAYLTSNGYQIDYSNRDKFIHFSKAFPYKIKKYFSSHLLLTRVIKNRTALLINYGMKFKVSQEDRKMATESRDRLGVPDQNDLPSTWPPSLRGYAERLEEAILLKWKDEAEKNRRQFAVLYIPRESEMRKDASAQDSWKDWLMSFCADKGITCIDPTQDLIRMQDAGKDIFYDHFTIYGHRALNDSFVEWFKQQNLPYLKPPSDQKAK